MSSSSSSILYRSTFLAKYLFSNSPIKPYSKSLISSYKHFSSLICPRQMSSSTAQIQNYSPQPWLMLPPKVFEGRAMDFNFYSLAENKVITLPGSGEKEVTDVMTKPNNGPDFDYPLDFDRVFRGSSHGWLALFNRRNLDLFLYNPISRRHIRLPPIHNLPSFPSHNSRNVAKVILSCSPDHENCRAMMICANLLAFCCPGRSKEWTPIGATHWWDEEGKLSARSYQDCVYSSEQELFFGLTRHGDLETWDLRDPSSPRMIMLNNLYDNMEDDEEDDEEDDDNFTESEDDEEDDDNFTESEDEEEEVRPIDMFCRAMEHLVVADHHLLVVTRYIMENVGPDGSYVDPYEEGSGNCPFLTVDFDIQKYDPEKGSFPYVDDSWLGGSTLFIGSESHTVAMPATNVPWLKPDSIYFTDAIGPGYWRGKEEDAPFGGHDIGIFNYQDKTVSSCYYPCDVESIKSILPKPMWFFPSMPI